MQIPTRFLKVLAVSWVAVLMAAGCAADVPDNTEVISTAAALPDSTVILGQNGGLRQWANQAQASDSFDTPEWSAGQATGAPDTERCGDYQTAWASASSDTVAWLEVSFPTRVHVTAVNVIQSFNPNQVTKVELLGDFGRVLEIYTAVPEQIDRPCPYTLSIPVPRTEATYSSVRITVDQSVLGLGWNEIDAVELVGDVD